MDFSTLKRNLKKEDEDLPKISAALLGDSPTQFLNIALRGYAIEENINLDLFEGEYNQIPFLIFNQSSELYQLQPKYVLIQESTEKLIEQFYNLNSFEKQHFANDHLSKVENYITAIGNQFSTTIIYSNFVEISDNVFGNFANKTSASFLYQLRKINLGLMDLSQEYSNFFIQDLSSIQNKIGRNQFVNSSVYANSGMVCDIESFPVIAKNYIDIIKAFEGRIKKCLVLDLDNTLWGGVIGDDGMDGIQIGNLGIGETFSRLQAWIKQLKERGIILAVCSKNEEKAAIEPFQDHPDMILRLEDIAVFVANWNNKADNIRHIQSILNIGFDSMVFIDDNPVERKIVIENLPEVTVPDLPEDPANYLAFLQNLNLFETTTFSELDGERTKQYQEESKRALKKVSFVNEDDFLKSLKMTGSISSFEMNDLPRVSQLSQRSNQFNLRTIRYSESDLKKIINTKNTHTFSFKLADSFGDYGLVCIVILKTLKTGELFIDTWLMSCRVLKRGLEHLVLNEIVECAKSNNITTIVGEYIPTPKNILVKDHYLNLGFVPAESENHWNLSVSDYMAKSHFINKKK